MMILMLAAMAALSGDDVVITAPARSALPPAASVAPLGAVQAPALIAGDSLATPPVQAHGLTTEQQIERWLSARSAADRGAMLGDMPEPERPERRIRGEITAGIGNKGYRDVGVSVDMPLGENAHGAFSYRRTEFDWR